MVRLNRSEVEAAPLSNSSLIALKNVVKLYVTKNAVSVEKKAATTTHQARPESICSALRLARRPSGPSGVTCSAAIFGGSLGSNPAARADSMSPYVGRPPPKPRKGSG